MIYLVKNKIGEMLPNNASGFFCNRHTMYVSKRPKRLLIEVLVELKAFSGFLCGLVCVTKLWLEYQYD